MKKDKKKRTGHDRNHAGMPESPMGTIYKADPFKDSKKVFGAEFNPMPAKLRMTTYDKVNSADH